MSHPPQLRNVTQTSVTLEWPKLELATAKLRSLDLYRDRQRVAAIPSPLSNTSTKVSGLQLDTEYTFQLVLRTTAGVYPSNVLRVRTHTMTDTSGISVCFGTVEDDVLLENAKMALREMCAKWSDKIQIDTTHFVCTTPAATPSAAHASNTIVTGPGVEYQKALQLSIPVVQPQWILACHAEKKCVLPLSPALPWTQTDCVQDDAYSTFLPGREPVLSITFPSTIHVASEPILAVTAQRDILTHSTKARCQPPINATTARQRRFAACDIPNTVVRAWKCTQDPRRARDRLR